MRNSVCIRCLAVLAATVTGVRDVAIPPGATVTFGFQATHTGTTSKQNAFTLNNNPCPRGSGS